MRIGFIAAMSSQNARSWAEALRKEGLEVHTWTMRAHEESRSPGMWETIKERKYLKRWLKQVQPDLVIAYRTTSYGFLAALSGFKPYVVAAQGESDAWPPNGFLAWVKRRLGYLALSRASRVHAWAQNMVPGLEKMGLKEHQLMLRPRGIDLKMFPFTPPSWQGPKLKIVVTRRLFPEYHTDQIIEAFGDFMKQTGNNGHELHIAGDGPELPALEEKVVELGLKDEVFFYGQMQYDALRTMISGAHIYCSMPDTEGASASLFEAFALGLLPVVSDLPANRAWIQHSVNGFLIKQGDIRQLTQTFKKILEEREKIPQILKKNRELAEAELSIEKNMAWFRKEYEQIILEQKA